MIKPRFTPGPLWQFLCPAWDAPTTALLRTKTRCAPRVTLRRCDRTPKPTTFIARCYNTAASGRHRAKRIVPNESSWDVSVESLYARLNASAIEGDIKGCQRVVEHLLEKRGERLSVTLYNALILANVDAASGGAWRVRELLEEMEVERYVPDTVTCHNILKVLAVHPDHLLRADVLHRMQKNWFTLSSDGLHDVAAGWLREGCLELAMEVLDNLQRSGNAVEPWLLDMFVYSLCDAHEVEAAYRIMQARKDIGELNISGAVWHYFLDAATNARHFAGTELAWRVKVRLGQLQVSTGICENALATVSMHGSPALATEIFAYSTKRGDPASHIHYQLLIDSYMHCEPPDIHRAISVLSVMPLERLQPSKWQTRSLFLHIRESADLATKTIGIVRDLHKQGRIVPIALVNVVVEALVYQGQYADAIDVYRQIPALLSANPEKHVPDLDTFDLVLRACELSHPPAVRQAEDLMSEMQAIGLDMSQDIRDRVARLNKSASLEDESEQGRGIAMSA